jgi:alpha-glucuronidase
MLCTICSWLLIALLVSGETGLEGWLRYARVPNAAELAEGLPSRIVVLNSTEGSPVFTAGIELQRGIEGIVGKSLDVSTRCDDGSPAIIVGTVRAYEHFCGGLEESFVRQQMNHGQQPLDETTSSESTELIADGFSLTVDNHGIAITALKERGVLYGAFALLSQLGQGIHPTRSYTSKPDAPLRWTNEWDNLDGSIERGYGGVSIFFANGTVLADLTRAGQYARLMVSIGINAIVVNNVNSNANIFSTENIAGLSRIADVFRPYGIQLGVAANFAAPKTLGGLPTFDPLDEDVIEWWNSITESFYNVIPDFAGYLIKANSEGQPGPLTYNRTFSQGANLFATALAPYAGIVMFRAFVWEDLPISNWTADRANTAYEYFAPLDGEFADNVVVQIKHGPIDFQVREAVHPLFAAMRKTNVAMEVQPSPEYLGQNCHFVYLAPMWKEVYDFDLRVDGMRSLVRDIVAGRRFGRKLGGYAGVNGVGSNMTWLGHHLAMSNIYAFGRLVWDPTLTSEDVLADWTRLTFGSDEAVLTATNTIAMASWPAYENYSGPLGIQTLTDIAYTHFGPNVATQDDSTWGQWTRSDAFSLGMDRTKVNGTANAALYPEEIARLYEDVETTPEELLLWFHHLNYTHTLRSGKTIIQHFYDAHYAGAETAQSFVSTWESLRGKIDEQRFEEVAFRLKFQAGHAIVWRDAINGFYRNLSGIKDEEGRVWNHPWRVEAESMTLDGYELYTVSPSETASNATAIMTSSNSTAGTASAVLTFPNGTYTLAVNFFDLYGGASEYKVYMNDEIVGEWPADWIDEGMKLGHEQSRYLDGHTATRITLGAINIAEGDVLKIVGNPDGIEPAPLDYVVFLPEGIID